jgi:NADPH:quinone reductase-like Zn-dependent oxidoreductase
MPRAVRFDRYGPVEELHIDEVERPSPGTGQVLVEVVAAGTNPGEIAIREGAMQQQFPATFPSGQGSDFAGRVVAVGEGEAYRDLARRHTRGKIVLRLR